jgi:hypothetical protein
MSSFNQIALADGTVLEASEWLHWPVYTSVEIGQADRVNLASFSYVVGGIVTHTSSIANRQATKLDTNLVRKNKMNQDEALIVMSFAHENFALTDHTIQSPPATVAGAPVLDAVSLRALQAQLVIELMVGAGIKKPQVGVPYSYLGQSLGTRMQASGDLAAFHGGTSGEITIRNMRQLGLPVYIGGFGENARPGNSMWFRLKIRSSSALSNVNQDLRQRWWLNGLKKRPA